MDKDIQIIPANYSSGDLKLMVRFPSDISEKIGIYGFRTGIDTSTISDLKYSPIKFPDPIYNFGRSAERFLLKSYQICPLCPIIACVCTDFTGSLWPF